ncbi:hypothetical protein Pryu01_00958 [Paraliobacillus ryukyuensis]|uniref:Lia operon protein LiaF n=1 Tax=Paraliobacillus ryukyuensis TaxID=200904 RepID=A0A366EFF8_9BACI|nr:cell wall-active antibiotics response protein LiaF [Paraliobacillus ryukyuensis]RBP00470.1 lia operon protein LiaF [Paraliobacillus ryukyuensis]
MFNFKNMNIIDYVLLGIIIFFCFEAVFIHTGAFIWLIVWLIIVYLARQHYYRPVGRIFFWVGIIGFGITLLGTMTFKLLLFLSIVLLLLHWHQSKQASFVHHPQFPSNDTVTEKKILFTNKWFGKQKTQAEPYEWDDINIQTLVGESTIDLTYTVLPKGEPLIVVRHLFGTVRIVIPFDVEVSVHHSVFLGSIDVLGHRDDQVTNRVIHLQTDGYQSANQKVKIVTSMIAGKIEVTRE